MKPISALLARTVVRVNMMAGYLPSLNVPTTVQNQRYSGANAPVASKCLCTCEETPTELPSHSQCLDQYSIPRENRCFALAQSYVSITLAGN